MRLSHGIKALKEWTSGRILTNNLENGSMAIKTEKQISEWLSQQKWIRSFIRNMRNLTTTSKAEAKRILAGQYKVNTIAAGFDWGISPQGFEFWKEKHEEFKQWYYGS